MVVYIPLVRELKRSVCLVSAKFLKWQMSLHSETCHSRHHLKNTTISTEGKPEIPLRALFWICSCKKRSIPLETRKAQVCFMSLLSSSLGS